MAPGLLQCPIPPAAVDAAGQRIPGKTFLRISSAIGFLSNRLAFMYYTPPTLLEISPTFGPKEGGTRVVVQGLGFVDHGGVFCAFDGVESPGELVSSNSIVCMSPAAVTTTSGGSGPIVPVLVTMNGLHYGNDTGEWSREISFEYVATPVVSFLSPSRGPRLISVTGSVASLKDVREKFRYLTVHGAHFADTKDLACRFGSFVTSATYVSESVVRCAVPLFSAATGEAPLVAVTTNGVDFSREGHSSATFRYFIAPEVLGLSPILGPARGGTEIAVVGKGFTSSLNPDAEVSAVCRFEVMDPENLDLVLGTLDVHAAIESDKAASCRTPNVTSLVQGRTHAYVRVSSDGGWSFSTSTGSFLFYLDGIVASVSPASVPSSTDTEIMISGRGFLHGEGLLRCVFAEDRGGIGDTDAERSGQAGFPSMSTATWLSPELIRCRVPPTKITDGKAFGTVVRVTNNGVDASPTSAQFLVYPDLEFKRLSPAAGPRTGGTAVTLEVEGWALPLGTYGMGATRCLWGTGASLPGTISETTEGVPDKVSITCVSPGIKEIVGFDDDEEVQEDVHVTILIDGQRALLARDPFRYYDVPILLGAWPAAGVDVGGTEVLIHGSGFSHAAPGGRGFGGALCRFGNSSVSSSVLSDSELRCHSPPWNGLRVSATGTAVPVQISLNGGADFSDSSLQFHYFPPATTIGEIPGCPYLKSPWEMSDKQIQM